jgi:predicted transcriptional regulator
MIVKNQTDLSERFEIAYNKIDQVIKKWVNYPDKRFTVLLREGAKHHQIIKNYSGELEQYGRLRNAIVHEKRELGSYIAEPHANVVNRIEKIANIFTQPNYALSIATKNLIKFDYNDNIVLVINAIQEYSYSQYPVYNNSNYVGLLTAKDIVKWMANYAVKSIVDLREFKIMDIFVNYQTLPVEFAEKSIDIFEVEKIFEHAHKNKSDLEAVIITENGNEDEKPLGIITPWDLIEIDYTAD